MTADKSSGTGDTINVADIPQHVGSGDFTLEFWLPPRPLPHLDKGWHRFEVKRDPAAARTFHHGIIEQIDGVNFLVTKELDAAGNLAAKHMVRADLVRG